MNYNVRKKQGHSGTIGTVLDSQSTRQLVGKLRKHLAQVINTNVPLSPSSIIWYWPKNADTLGL